MATDTDAHSLRVLVVDDLPDLRFTLMLMLESAGYRVAEAADGLQALECISQHNVDVLLMDMIMPGMDGVTLLGELRERGIKVPRVVAMTSRTSGSVTALEVARVLGADAALTKPFNRNQLLNAIRG